MLRTPEECGVSRPSWTTSTSTTRWTTTSSGRDGWSPWSTTRPSATSGPQYRHFDNFVKYFKQRGRHGLPWWSVRRVGLPAAHGLAGALFLQQFLCSPYLPHSLFELIRYSRGSGVDLINIWEWFAIFERIEILNIHLLIVIIISSGRHDSLRILPLIRFCQ